VRLAEERKAFIEENGIKLSDKQLEGIAGGAGHTNTDPQGCPETFFRDRVPRLGSHRAHGPERILRGYLAGL
jgi:hypothetical protein